MVAWMLIKKAYKFALEKHSGQVDDCGKPYIEHPYGVMTILATITSDEELLAAALLHDTLEDTYTTLGELEKEFGPRIADIVDEVTHRGKADDTGFSFPLLKSRDAIMLKFADRLHNLSRMENWSEERKEHYLKKSKFWRS